MNEKLQETIDVLSKLDADTLKALIGLAEKEKIENDVKIDEENKKPKKKQYKVTGERTTRPLELEEYNQIINLIKNGFTYDDYDKVRKFRPNRQVALALILEANLGIRISDVMQLKVSTFRSGKLNIKEKKTKKYQDRDINPELRDIIIDYALEKGLRKNDYLFDIGIKNVQKALRIVTRHLGLINVSTHSFRKMYATNQYIANGNDIAIVKDLLNHSSVAITENYIAFNKERLNEVSANYYIGTGTNEKKDK